MTVRDLLKSSLRLINALAPGEAGENADLEDARLVANDLLETWRLEKLMVPHEQREVFTLTASHNPHTIGTGGDFVTTRPVRIERAGLVDTTQSPDYERPIEVIGAERYSRIALKDFESSWPDRLYYRYATTSALSAIFLYPVPSEANDLALYTWKPLASFDALGDTVVVPVGYTRALRYNLAMDLAPEFNLPVPEHVSRIASMAKAAIGTINLEVPELRCESSTARGGDPYWWRAGE